ncbi:MAG TPA: arginase family protein [Chloroflexota bacterium]|nr:arginase family protein [Chloroflexota bacterium]
MPVAVICVPYSNDVARWGAAQGPQAILDAGLVDALRAAGQTVDDPSWIELPRQERTRDIVTNLGKIASRTSDAVRDALDAGKDVIVLEGDCTHAPGAAGGLARAAGTAGVVWFDAHGDMNTTATTETGLWGGMPYAVMLGWDLDDWREAAGLREPVRAEAAALVGAGDLDQAEIDALQRHPIARLDASDMMEQGSGEALMALLAPRAGEADAWYLHVDLDVAGPEEVPGGHTPAPHWPPREQLIEAIAAAAWTVPVRVLALAAYNPAGDPERRGARFAVDVALAAVGRKAAPRA